MDITFHDAFEGSADETPPPRAELGVEFESRLGRLDADDHIAPVMFKNTPR
jgi:hypothetical protein